jgi:hypothetical protein
MLQSQKRASRCREIASTAFLAKICSGGRPQTPLGLRVFGTRATGETHRTLKKFSDRSAHHQSKGLKHLKILIESFPVDYVCQPLHLVI